MGQGKTRYWRDIRPGETFETAAITLSTEDILEFAADFDPQPYHLDNGAAAASIFGGLCASGWHVCAVMMRLLTDTFVAARIDLLGSSGVGALRWRKPVFAGDALSSTITVSECLAPVDKSEFGRIVCAVDVSNQQGDSVITLTTTLLIGGGSREAGSDG
ncbi:dehydratase [Exilibacterium tricleocarpae]|uniref:Dehydratase n=1 Tax=Exilibacterium tricleocarpae TaxID=2591008 RepID=A0A545U9N9_9GAMM|nr:MaoC/PaaZ C-terminal domain-containing protein [Exilibacterium tricleocarpae]TQV86187.1 dehydratase [Exilibacterium tricleocarpae]